MKHGSVQIVLILSVFDPCSIRGLFERKTCPRPVLAIWRAVENKRDPLYPNALEWVVLRLPRFRIRDWHYVFAFGWNLHHPTAVDQHLILDAGSGLHMEVSVPNCRREGSHRAMPISASDGQRIEFSLHRQPQAHQGTGIDPRGRRCWPTMSKESGSNPAQRPSGYCCCSAEIRIPRARWFQSSDLSCGASIVSACA